MVVVRDMGHTASSDVMLPSHPAGRVFGTSDRTRGHEVRKTGSDEGVAPHVSASKVDLYTSLLKAY